MKRQFKFVFVLLLFFCTSAMLNAATKTWFSTTSGGAWTSASNWGGSLPDAGDDIVINISGSSNFTITSVASLTFNSVTIGGSGTGTVTLQSSASTGSFGTFTVNANTSLTGFSIMGITLTGTSGSVAAGKLLTIGSSASLKMSTNVVFTVNGTITTTSSANANPFTTSSASCLVVSNGGVINYNGGSSMLNTALMTVQSGGTVNVICSNTVTLSAMAISGKLSIQSTGTSPINTTGNAPAYAQGSTLEYYNCSAIPDNTKAWPTTNGPTNVIINSPNGVTIAATRTLTGVLTLTSGILTTTASSSLLVTNSATTAITGGSNSSFISGPVNWSMSSGNTYTVPVGKGNTFLPFTITPSGSAPVIQTEAFNTACNGIPQPDFVSLSNTEFWSALVYSGTLSNASVGLTRQTPAGTLNAIGRSNTMTGVYECLNGNPSGNSIFSSDATGSLLGYFAMGLRDDFVGTETPVEKPQFLVYPNPVQDRLMFSLPIQTQNPSNIQIFDITGKLCLQEEVSAQTTEYSIDIQHLTQGKYSILWTSGAETKTLSFLKK